MTWSPISAGAMSWTTSSWKERSSPPESSDRPWKPCRAGQGAARDRGRGPATDRRASGRSLHCKVMSLSSDIPSNDAAATPRALARWLDDCIDGRCTREEMKRGLLELCRRDPEAPWDALALLDQYQRLGRLDSALVRELKGEIAHWVFGPSSLPPRDELDASDDTVDTAPASNNEHHPDTADVPQALSP